MLQDFNSAYDEGNEDVKGWALRELPKFNREPLALQITAEALSNKSEPVKIAAIEALGDFNDTGVVAWLYEVLEGNPTENILKTVLHAFEKLGKPKANV